MKKSKDLTQQKFGNLIAIKRTGTHKNKCALWLCRCDCGQEVEYSTTRLTQGKAVTCGKHKVPDLLGLRFGKLLVLERTANAKNGHSKWVCRCDCGKETSVPATQLKTGKTQSCGCLRFSLKPLDITNASGLLDKTKEAERIYNSYRRNAGYRHTVFSISLDEFLDLISRTCHYCGAKPWKIFNGVDKKDPLKGYIPENCLPCCWFCNRAKHSTSYEDFCSWIDRLALYRTRQTCSIASSAIATEPPSA